MYLLCWEHRNILDNKLVSNIGFITVHGLNEGHIAPKLDNKISMVIYLNNIYFSNLDPLNQTTILTMYIDAPCDHLQKWKSAVKSNETK